MNFWPFKRSKPLDVNSEFKIDNEGSVEKTVTQLEITPPTIGELFQEFLRNNMPKDFEMKLDRTKPYILASFIAWPLYWLYRGIEWKSHRQSSRLPMYIQKTYLQAKFIQFSIIMCGLAMASLFDESRLNTNPQEKQ